MKPRFFVAAGCALFLAACGEAAEHAPSGLEEPFVASYVPVRETRAVAAQFFQGELPKGSSEGPTTSITNRQSAVFPGTSGKRIGGNSGITATSVAMKFKDLGTGFWVVPTTIPDADLKGTILWDAQLSFSRNLPAGRLTLQVVSSDPDGHFGEPTEIPLVVQPTIPQAPVVASLTWDTNADLDLQIMTPDGRTLDPKHPATTSKVDGGYPPGTGVLDRDSNAGCVLDGIRRENVVWNDYPPPGIYLAKVDMFSACGEAVANFAFQIYVQGQPYGEAVVGRLLSIHADNGGPGLAITNFQFQP
jgi:hypothetical protein